MGHQETCKAINAKKYNLAAKLGLVHAGPLAVCNYSLKAQMGGFILLGANKLSKVPFFDWD